MEWEIGSLGRGKYRLSLVRIAEGETPCEVLEDGAVQACVILADDLDVAHSGGRTQSVGAGNETNCNRKPPNVPSLTGSGEVFPGIVVGARYSVQRWAAG